MIGYRSSLILGQSLKRAAHLCHSTGTRALPLHQFSRMSFSTNKAEEQEIYGDHTHFRASAHQHPLKPKASSPSVGSREEEIRSGDHTGRQQNHIWTAEELEVAMGTLYRHQPKTFGDHLMHKLARCCNILQIRTIF
jgi:hypothetical protein